MSLRVVRLVVPFSLLDSDEGKTMNTAEMVNTKTVTGRRELHYDNYDEQLADAERLAGMEVRTLGNWSYGQILLHLARSIDVMIDGAPFSFPAPVQWVMSLLMKKKFLTKGLTPGFKLPKNAGRLIPEEASVEEGMAEYRTAINRAKTESKRAPHGGFGKMSKDECDQFQFRHAEMHMSFVVPQDTQ